MHKKWFPAKRYGWGWGLPQTWQGWVVFLAYMLFLMWDFHRIDSMSHSASDTLRPFCIDTGIATGVLVIICFLTGEKPRWRWGA